MLGKCIVGKNIAPSSFSRSSFCNTSSENLKADRADLDKLVNADKVVTFIKGVPEQPMCGFSRVVVQILNMHGVKFSSHNILENETLRQSMKEYSNWPTFPQVYVGGKFVGGADILIELHKSKEIVDILKGVGIKSQYDEDEKK